jgi:hypothetical protein
MGKDSRAVALSMLVEPDAGAGLAHDRGERGLADLKRIGPQVVAVRLPCFRAIIRTPSCLISCSHWLRKSVSRSAPYRGDYLTGVTFATKS